MLMGYLKETGFAEERTTFSGDNCNMPRSVAHISIMFIYAEHFSSRKLNWMKFPAHILIKCLQHGVNTFAFENQSAVLEIYNVTTSVFNESQIDGRLL
jgi:hypothetical protein